MTIPQVQEAILQQTPITIRLLFGEEIGYKRALRVLPMQEGECIPLVELEDKNGSSITKCAITQILGGDPFEVEEQTGEEPVEKESESTPEAACERKDVEYGVNSVDSRGDHRLRSTVRNYRTVGVDLGETGSAGKDRGGAR